MLINKENHNNLIYIILIVLLCTLFFILAYAKFGMFFIDTSREAYVPMAMNDGAVLYKDIYNVYSPLGYQINAILYKFFGENLNTLYIAGFINCNIFLIGFFLLCKNFFKDSKYTAFVLTVFLMFFSAFAISLFNYFFPYSYSMVYAMNAFLWSFLFLVNYFESQKSKFLILSFFFFGISIACKYEYIFFSLLLFSVPFIKKCDLKILLSCFAVFLIVPVISIISLILQGCSFADFNNALLYMIALAKSESVSNCYKTMGLIPTFDTIRTLIISLVQAIIFFGALLTAFYFAFEKITNKFIKIFIFSFIILLIIIILYPYFYGSNSNFFSWIGFINVLILIAFLIKKRNKLENNDVLFLILNISSILISFKNICFISTGNYGNFFFPFILLSFFYFLYNYLPEYFTNFKFSLKAYQYSLIMIFVALTLLYSVSNIKRRDFAFPSKVETQRGTIYMEENRAQSVNKILEYINNNTSKEDTILVLCEGAMINFLTDRKSHNMFYYLIPPNIQVLKEDNIVSELENNTPDYIVLQPMSYLNFKETFFCESFGNKICRLLPKYYEPPVVFGNDFWLAIYKKKDL